MHPIPICPACEGFYENCISEFPSLIFGQLTNFAQHLINFCDFGILTPESPQIRQVPDVAQHLLLSYPMDISKVLLSFREFCPAPSIQKKFCVLHKWRFFLINN